jgi:hypothetical protein
VEFVDSDGNIIVPKSVRPIIDLKETVLGGKRGARKQYRQGTLHIREYDTHYTVHVDRVDPLKSPLGHLILDAPEYIVGAAAAALVARRMGGAVYSKRRGEGTPKRDAAIEAAVAGYIAGSTAGRLAHDAANRFKKSRVK